MPSIKIASRDWTVDPKNRAKSSKVFRFLAIEIERLLCVNEQFLCVGRTDVVAREILTKLAHEYGLAPSEDFLDELLKKHGY